ncbi:MAG: hypothetical protein KH230_24830 [Enterocloster asparagiformis]|nr:hypothetical protein [Enterocloster asparagiformis]
MRGENNTKRGKVRGSLFEIVLQLLLEKSGFHMVLSRPENKDRVRMNRPRFVELKGRGGWHQIDCPFDYGGFIPFLYPVRLLGEAKFLQTEVQKSAIRSLIGVLKDIQENYFVDDSLTDEMVRGRRLELGAFFAANGFNREAEKLAYAHGIRTVSYRNNRSMESIKNWILYLEEHYISSSMLTDSGRIDFLAKFEKMLRGDMTGEAFAWDFDMGPNAGEALSELANSLEDIKTNFLASTDTGVLLHFLGAEAFPEELFDQGDVASCRIRYERRDAETNFYLVFSQDRQSRRFYFTPPDSLGEAALFGGNALDEKERHYKVLHTQIMIKGLRRSLDIRLDQDWLEAQRELNMAPETL